MGIEDERPLAFTCPLGPDVLLVRHMTGAERLGECFEYVLMLFSTKHDIKAEDLLGQHASVRMHIGAQAPRFFDGIVCEFGHTGHSGRYATYRLVLRPWLWLLSRNRQCRIFQQKTTLDIAREVFSDQGFSDLENRLMKSLEAREYCVQYRESDLAFVSRLFEDEGIYFWFKHEFGKHTLVLADSMSAHQPVAKFETLHFKLATIEDPHEASVSTWTSNKRVQAGKVELRDYDFKKPRADMDAHTSNPNHHEHAKAEIYDYPGQYLEVSVGEDRARVRLEEVLAGYEISEGSTDASGLGAGALFTLKDHPRASENHQYMITSIAYNADSGSFESGSGGHLQFAAHVRAVDSSIAFRPARVTHAPIVPGAQTATVVGPKANEIWTDQYGRVKVQFHWDREGKFDESSSCWVRVAQLWTGNGWGSLHIPRIGQEVVVEFLDGNPDRPLVTGCVYNESNRPPYELPAHQTQSGIKTRSSKGGGPDDFNELRFEDKKGAEQLVVHAQRNMATTVERDRTIAVGHDETHNVKNDLTITAKQIMEHGQEKVVVDVGSCQLTIDKTSVVLKISDSSIALDPTGITINGQGSKVVLNAAGVSIDGVMVNINS